MNSKSNETRTETSNAKFVLVTESSYSILKEILENKCIGVVRLYEDEDIDIIEGDFKNGKISSSDYSWEWAHMIYYSYERLTSDVGEYEHEDFFERGMGEFIYIFEDLTEIEISMIEHIVNDFSLLFKIDERNLHFAQKIANLTHNYSSAWERVNMKYLPCCDDYESCLVSASRQLKYLQQHLNEYNFNYDIDASIEEYERDIESFEDDDRIRSFLLDLYKQHVTLIH